MAMRDDSDDPMNPDPSSRASGVISRRRLLRNGAVGLAAGGALGLRIPGAADEVSAASGQDPRAALISMPGMAAQDAINPHSPGNMATVGVRGPDGFDPTAFLTDFDYGRVSTLPSGQTLREYDIAAVDREIEIAPGVFFPAWTYNGQVPGPTIRCTEGDRIRINFANAGSHAHTMHFHGIHAANMDGVFEVIEPGNGFVYEFDAAPFGLQLYHCHSIPLKRHIHKGLYGTFIIDPLEGRPPAKELVMVMNGFDTNFDGDNEIYAVNTVGFAYHHAPIQLSLGELVRVYLVNLTEFDLINSFHLHGNFFRHYPTGTDLERYEWTDTVMLCQGQRSVLEFSFEHEGRFMFHAHQSEFAELGWMGMFDVGGPGDV
jgi:FtsP/CotA-like multicopper oxidase with cupredoxin domain